MIAVGKPCPRCKSLLSMVQLPPFQGGEGALQVHVKGMPALACDAKHAFFADPGFPLWLMRHLVDEDEAKLPAGEAKGMIIKHYVCHDCGKNLAPKPDHTHSFDFAVQPDGLAAFSVALSMPVYKCTGCGKEQLHSLAELRKLTAPALAHAFQAGGLPPPGP